MRPSSCGGAHRGSIDAATDATAAANPIAEDGEPSIAPEHSAKLEAKQLQRSSRSSFLRDLGDWSGSSRGGIAATQAIKNGERWRAKLPKQRRLAL